ncbi:hypothetical protein [Stackebrandtia soli]|uniref:hypothetical protein n=1 Tax=Stackebrandtia soli TaxID=1892856 RepID=UPI0039EA9146
MTAKRVAPATKAWLAAGGLIVSGGLGLLAWANGFTAIAILFWAFAVLALVDIGWQSWKRQRGVHD